jgi:vacuolar protein sorting-associated protein 13A/C
MPNEPIALILRSKYPDSGGAFKVQIYSPFILVNHTGLPFTLRSGNSKLVANQNNPGVQLHTPTPFSKWLQIRIAATHGLIVTAVFSHSQSGGNEFSFRIRDSAWSKVRNSHPSRH